MITETRQGQSKQVLARGMHKYVWILLGVFTLIVASFPTALIRVSKDKKFADYNFHVKSLTLEGKLSKPSGESLEVQPVANNSSEQTFNASNTDKIHPSSGASTTPQEVKERHPSNLTAEITNSELLAVLNQKLYDRIAQLWQASQHKPEQELGYRVSVNHDGTIASFEPLSQVAFDYLQKTPLPNLGKSNSPVVTASSTSDNTHAQTKELTQESLNHFRVVFTPQGVLEVSPWHGWGR